MTDYIVSTPVTEAADRPHHSRLFSPITLRGTTFRNRIWLAPMCQYSATDGHVSDWHLVHLGAVARGGAALILTEATAISPDGRTTPQDTGIWSDDHIAGWSRITDFIRSQGAVPGIQLAHGGRKSSCSVPWDGAIPIALEDGGWDSVGPSATPYADWPTPKELTTDEIHAIVQTWSDAASRALKAGFEVVEIHAAHGYLLHQFLSPLTNFRQDEYGGDLAGRTRILIEVVDAVRLVWPEEYPLFVRVSGHDWVPGGLQPADLGEVGRMLAGHGVDLIDVSSAGLSPDQKLTVSPGYQVPFAHTVKKMSGLPVAAVGLITEPQHAEAILAQEQADVILLGRSLMRDPGWPQRAAFEMREDVYWPNQYLRIKRVEYLSQSPERGDAISGPEPDSYRSRPEKG